ncbi:MAG: hypothetical protein ACXWT0_03830 [Methylobacter sp.]
MQINPSYNYRDITLNSGVYQAAKEVLCSRCIHPVCADFAALRCHDFTPALKFKPPLRGFDNATFNTFRCGVAWSKRVTPGSLVALVNAKTDEAFGYAKVTAAHVGEKRSMAELHGEFNHSIQALEIKTNIADVMLKRLKNSSGSMIYNNNDKVTVIYLERLTEYLSEDIEIGKEKEDLAT